MDNNSQININDLSNIQEINDNLEQSQMSILNQLNNEGNFINQNQIYNSNSQISMNNFENNYNQIHENMNNLNNINIPYFSDSPLNQMNYYMQQMMNNNPLLMNNNLNQQMINNYNQIFMNNNLNQQTINNNSLLMNNNLNQQMNNNNPFFINNNFNQEILPNNDQTFVNNNLNPKIKNNINISQGLNLYLKNTRGKKKIININPYSKVSDLFKIIRKRFKSKHFFLLYNALKISKDEERPLLYIFENNAKILILDQLLDENVDIDANIIVANDNHPKFNLNNLHGVFETLFIKRDRKNYKRKFRKRIFK